MAKLVDALPSGGSVRKDVQVRILFWAQASLLSREAFYLLWEAFKRKDKYIYKNYIMENRKNFNTSKVQRMTEFFRSLLLPVSLCLFRAHRVLSR